MEGFNLNRLMTGGLLTGIGITILFSMWGKIKAWLHHITGYAIQRITLQPSLRYDFVDYLISKRSKSRIYDRVYGEITDMLKVGHKEGIGFELYGDTPLIFWVKGWPVFYAPIAKKKDSSEGEGMSQLSFLRGTVDIDSLIVAAVKTFNDRLSSNRDADASLSRMQSRLLDRPGLLPRRIRSPALRRVCRAVLDAHGADARGLHQVRMRALSPQRPRVPHVRAEGRMNAELVHLAIRSFRRACGSCGARHHVSWYERQTTGKLVALCRVCARRTR